MKCKALNFQTGGNNNEELSMILRAHVLQENRFGNLSVTNASAQGKSCMATIKSAKMKNNSVLSSPSNDHY